MKVVKAMNKRECNVTVRCPECRVHKSKDFECPFNKVKIIDVSANKTETSKIRSRKAVSEVKDV